MNLKEVLAILIKKFQEKKIDFLLSGGLALSTMNIFRFTKDIDFLVLRNRKMIFMKLWWGWDTNG